MKMQWLFLNGPKPSAAGNMQQISAKFTFFYKYLVLLGWVVGFAWAGRTILFSPPYFTGQWLPYAGIWLLVAVLLILLTGSIKSVRLDHQARRIEVSNFLKTTSIDYREIAAVDGSAFLSPKLVWFDLKSASMFGKRIAFMPVHRWTGLGIGKHPLIYELRSQLGLDQPAA